MMFLKIAVHGGKASTSKELELGTSTTRVWTNAPPLRGRIADTSELGRLPMMES
jgi:hypothetical protein